MFKIAQEVYGWSWKCVISFQTSLLDMLSPTSQYLMVTNSCLCSCVSFNVPQVTQDISLLVNFSCLNGFEASDSFHGKAGKLDLRLEDQCLEFLLGVTSLGSWRCSHLLIVSQPQTHCPWEDLSDASVFSCKQRVRATYWV